MWRPLVSFPYLDCRILSDIGLVVVSCVNGFVCGWGGEDSGIIRMALGQVLFLLEIAPATASDARCKHQSHRGNGSPGGIRCRVAAPRLRLELALASAGSFASRLRGA